jgi:pilus retraction protein PilT
MKTQAVTPEYVGKIVPALSSHPLLRGIDARALAELATTGVLAQYVEGEAIWSQGDKAESWGVLLRGQVAVRATPAGLPETFDVDRLQPVEVIGELEVLMGMPCRFTLIALEAVLLLRLPPEQLRDLFQRAPTFSVAIAQSMAQKFLHVAPKTPLPFYDLAQALPPPEVVSLLPMQFIERQRVLPVASQGARVVLGFVDDLLPHAFQAARQFLPGLELLPVRIDGTAYQQVLQSMVSAESELRGDRSAAAGLAAATAEQRLLSAPRLDPLLKRMVAEGASDLHLSAHHRPRWRIDGEMREIADAKVLGDTTVWDLLEPAMPERNRKQFLDDNDTDFAYQIPDVARFRVNVFRDHYGIGAVLRVIPSKILTMEQLGLPEGVRRMCDHPKGLVLVTGPTGSGKSTSLAAMIDYINRNRRSHIITLEDPIEFLHKSQRSLVNQREVGPHTQSFNRALRAALREDPDIVLVGEMRDRETIQLALETANTGHLVFGTLHTSTAINTVDRIIDVFPPEQQAQVRTVVADVLKGVVSQTLLKRRGGGRVAALEVLIGSHAVSNLIREAKNHHIFNIMLTQKVQGNQLLNDQLEQLVRDGKVEYDEALLKSLDKVDLAKRFGKEYFEK